MPASIILASRYHTKLGTAQTFAKLQLLHKKNHVFIALKEDEVLVLEQIAPTQTVQKIAEDKADDLKEYSEYLVGDINRELLRFVEAPKPFQGEIPRKPYIQLRHVEVKPSEMSRYRDWRDETIFDVARNAEEIEGFAAYHSVISGQPGVMFISGFSVDPKGQRFGPR